LSLTIAESRGDVIAQEDRVDTDLLIRKVMEIFKKCRRDGRIRVRYLMRRDGALECDVLRRRIVIYA